MFDALFASLLSLVAFGLVISFVVVIHELGHYWTGRCCGVHAEVFSIGFGPTLFAWTDRNGTDWRVAALPLGGYVRFRGDENAASAPDRESLERLRGDRVDADTVFHFKPVWQRALIVLAGPVANFVLAVVLFAAIGLMRGEITVEPRATAIVPGSSAEAAGFEPGDLVIAVDGRSVTDFSELTRAVFLRAGQEMQFTVERGDQIIELVATPRREVLPDGLGGERARGVLGLMATGPTAQSFQRISLFEAPLYGVQKTFQTASMTVDYIGRLVTGRASTDFINGPIGIATTAGQIANQAITANPEGAGDIPAWRRAAALFFGLLTLSALLSVALGLMNLLPIPVLDGGHLVYYAYEAVAKRPPSPGVQAMGFRLGVALILGMMLVAGWNDISYLRDLFS